MVNSLYYSYRGMTVNTEIHEGKVPELERMLPFLRELLDNLPKDATLERIEVKQKAEMRPPPPAVQKNDYVQTCEEQLFADAVVHTYWSKDYLSRENPTPEHTIIIYVNPGNSALKIEKLYTLRTTYPFLDTIVRESSYPLFDINEAAADDSVLEEKCQDHDSQGPESFDSSFYAILKHRARELAVYEEPLLHAKMAIEPSPTVREELARTGITPDYLVKKYHLKYEVRGEHCHDITLTVYKR